MQNPEELDRLMKEDPPFRDIIIQRDKALAQIQTIKYDLLSRKKALDGQIEKSRADYDKYAKAQNLVIEQYRATMDTHRKLLERETGVLKAQLETKMRELTGYETTLVDIRKILREGKGLNLSNSERQKWEDKVLMLSEKIHPLREQIQDFKLQIRLKKQKIAFLK